MYILYIFRKYVYAYCIHRYLTCIHKSMLERFLFGEVRDVESSHGSNLREVQVGFEERPRTKLCRNWVNSTY